MQTRLFVVGGAADSFVVDHLLIFLWKGAGGAFWRLDWDLLTMRCGLEPTLSMGLAEGLPTFGEETLALQVLVAFLQVRG